MAEPTVTIATTPEAVEALRPVWGAMEVSDIDSDLDYFLTVAINADQVISPYVIRIRRPGLSDILIVARLEKLPVRFKLAYRTLGQVRLKAIVVTFGGVLGARSPQDERLVLAELQRLLDARAADLILMRNVDPAGTLHEAARKAVAPVRIAQAQAIDRLWAAALPKSLDAFLAGRSAKSRSSFRREDRLLREAFGEQLLMRRFQHPEELDELCRDMAHIATRTYQYGLGAGFADTPMERALVALGLRRGFYRCWMLYIAGKPVAFWAGSIHGGTFFPTTPGFDPAFGQHSVGRYTMFRMIEDLCAEGLASRIDFGRGDAQYKVEYASSPRQATDLWVAARRPGPMAAIGALSLTGMINSRGRQWAGRLQLAKSLKTRWRRRLANGIRQGSA